MDLTLTTPALLFPAISLLLLAYTNRFLSLAALMRELHARYRTQPDPTILGQLANLRYRIVIIRNMQACGVASFFGCVLCMFVLFAGHLTLGQWIFGAALLLLLLSLALSLREIQVSIDALTLQIADLEAGPVGTAPAPRRRVPWPGRRMRQRRATRRGRRHALGPDPTDAPELPSPTSQQAHDSRAAGPLDTRAAVGEEADAERVPARDAPR